MVCGKLKSTFVGRTLTGFAVSSFLLARFYFWLLHTIGLAQTFINKNNKVQAFLVCAFLRFGFV